MKKISIFIIAVFCAAVVISAPITQTLCDFRDRGIRIERRQVQTAVTPSGALKLTFKTGQEKWPGITISPPGGKWNISQYSQITLAVFNPGTEPIDIAMRVDNPGANGIYHCLQKSVTVAPGERKNLKIPYSKMKIPLFGMSGYPAEIGGMPTSRSIDPQNVTAVLIFMSEPTKDQTIEVEKLFCSGKPLSTSAHLNAQNFFPFIDKYGQYIHREWPGKIHDDNELARSATIEKQDLVEHPGPRNWNQWGGWLDGPQLKATGFFRTEKVDGQWFLVDPSGKLFFSNGITGVSNSAPTAIDDREYWYQGLPSKQDPVFKSCYDINRFSIPIYHYYKKTPITFDFAKANIIRKYGSNWQEKNADLIHTRFRSWGINTIGNWSDPMIYLKRRTPYFATLWATGGPKIEGSAGYWGKFVDIFSPEFRSAIERSLLKNSETINDPWCIGYFVDNEITWGNDISLAVAALISPSVQPAKKILIADLKAKYGTIEKLNQAWNTSFSDWENLAENRRLLTDDCLARARADLKVFYRKCVENYFRTIRDVLKKHAPHQLYAGCRFAGRAENEVVVEVAGQYCDIVSYNVYNPDIANFKPTAAIDKPLIIGEFHFGALDRGLFSPGFNQVVDQNARAEAYRNYLTAVLRHPAFVGCHWFKYKDSPTTGRPLDGECHQIGFVDVADTPYTETIAASREIGAIMYDFRQQAAPGKQNSTEKK